VPRRGELSNSSKTNLIFKNDGENGRTADREYAEKPHLVYCFSGKGMGMPLEDG
jgi:hypothetical protein